MEKNYNTGLLKRLESTSKAINCFLLVDVIVAIFLIISTLVRYRIINLLINRMSVLTYYLFQYRLEFIPESGAIGIIFITLTTLFVISVVISLTLYGLIRRYRLKTIFNFLQKTEKVSLASYKIGSSDFITDNILIRNAIGRAVTGLNNYLVKTRMGIVRPYNILLIAKPGTGKSFLARSLANILKVDFKLKEYNLTNIETALELKEFFLDIRSFKKDCDKNKKYPFILLDECDSKLDFPLFQKLLMPIYDGKLSYLSEGRDLFNCIFIFVISKIRDDKVSKISRRFKSVFSRKEFYDLWSKDIEIKAKKYFFKQPKGPDFFSRIDNTVIMPSMDDDTGYYYRMGSFLPSREMDTVLKIIVFIKKYYGKLVKEQDALSLQVEKNVFLVLTVLSSKRFGSRELENIFFKSSQPKDGRFGLKNLPSEHLEQIGRKTKIIDLLKERYLTITP